MATGSNDYTVKFWARNRPGDPLGILPEVFTTYLDLEDAAAPWWLPGGYLVVTTWC